MNRAAIRHLEKLERFYRNKHLVAVLDEDSETAKNNLLQAQTVLVCLVTIEIAESKEPEPLVYPYWERIYPLIHCSQPNCMGYVGYKNISGQLRETRCDGCGKLYATTQWGGLTIERFKIWLANCPLWNWSKKGEGPS